MSFSADERDQELCRHIKEAHGLILRYIEGIDLKGFITDSKTQDAVTMRLQQILESAAKLSAKLKDQINIEWSMMTAMRNKISHSYADVDPEITWEVIQDFEEFKILIQETTKRI